MGDKKKKKQKDRSRSRSEEKKKKSKKSKSQKSKDKGKEGKKKKSQKKARQSSKSSVNSSDQQAGRSRNKDEKQQTKKEQKSGQLQKSNSIQLPFELGTKVTTLPILTPMQAMRPGNMPPPSNPAGTTGAATTAATAPASNKPKTKQYHIFKLLPRLPVGCVTLAKTLYSSSYLSDGFEKKLFGSLCQEVERTAKTEGSKKMASTMSKIRTQINQMQQIQRSQSTQKKFDNQFQIFKDLFIQQKNKLKQSYLQKTKKPLKEEVVTK